MIRITKAWKEPIKILVVKHTDTYNQADDIYRMLKVIRKWGKGIRFSPKFKHENWTEEEKKFHLTALPVHIHKRFRELILEK